MSQFEGRVGDGCISFAIGAPNDALLELASDIFSKSSQAFSQDPRSTQLFQYGPNAGSRVFLDALAHFLSEELSDSVRADHLLLTCGASNGLHLAASTLVCDKGVVFVENPTYFIALDILDKDLGLKVIDFDYESIEETISREIGASVCGLNKYWGLIYVIPTFHNPTGGYLKPEYCQKLIDVAVKHNLLIVCDDVYNLLYYDKSQQPPVRLLQYDKTCPNIISNGSFSKILAPGYRVGWIEAAPQTIKRLASSGVLSSGGAANNVMSGIIAAAIESGLLQKHLSFLREEYGNRMKTTCSTLSKLLPKGFNFLAPLGGYFIWVSGPSDFDGTKFAEFCGQSAYKVVVLPGEKATACRNSTDAIKRCVNAFRLSIAHNHVNDLVLGANRLVSALRDFLKTT